MFAQFNSICRPTVILALTMGLVVAAELRAEEPLKTTKAGEITLKVPPSWKVQQPSSNLRVAQFEIPAVEGDPEPAELAIFTFGGAAGGVQANVTRWIEQFSADGRKAESKTGKCPQGEYVIVDVTGTYKKPIGPPIQMKTQPLPNARMLAAILAIEGKGNYFLKLTGPGKTVTAAAEAFRASFGGNSADEKPLGDKP